MENKADVEKLSVRKPEIKKKMETRAHSTAIKNNRKDPEDEEKRSIDSEESEISHTNKKRLQGPKRKTGK